MWLIQPEQEMLFGEQYFINYLQEKNDVLQLTEKEGAEYLEFANIAAGICVEKRGAIPAMPSLEDVLLKNLL